MEKKRLPVAVWAFWMPAVFLVAAFVFYFARGGDETTRIPNGLVDIDRPTSPCFNPNRCLEPSKELSAAYTDADACSAEGEGGLVLCMALLGDVPLRLARYLVQYYETEYGLTVHVLPPLTIPEEFVLTQNPQYSAEWLMAVVTEEYAGESLDLNVRLVALTAVDIWLPGRTRWNWAFGQLSSPEVHGPKYVHGIISIYRMDDRSWGPFYNEERFYNRVRKMMNKYVAITYYGLPFSPDPTSATYSDILSTYDLDRMAEHIPVP